MQAYGDLDWDSTIKDLRRDLTQRYHGHDQRLKEYRQAISFAFQLPSLQRSMKPNREHASILFRCRYFRQYRDKDWHAELRQIAGRDLDIYNYRERAKKAGVITNVEYQPYTRQAYNWLCKMAEEDGAVERGEGRVQRRHYKFVQVYGGAIINSIFVKNEKQVDKIVNWATPYFFERLIHKTYDIDQILRIKEAELSKTSDSLVQHIA